MNIQYTYEIVAVNEAARVMEVVYTAEGHPTQHIGARLPYDGESLEAVIHMFSPVALWRELSSVVVPPAVGVTGTISVQETNEVVEGATPTAEEIALGVRKELLTASDWTQLPDVSLSAEKKAEWAVYRQALRDITDQAEYPNDIQWPVQPE